MERRTKTIREVVRRGRDSRDSLSTKPGQPQLLRHWRRLRTPDCGEFAPRVPQRRDDLGSRSAKPVEAVDEAVQGLAGQSQIYILDLSKLSNTHSHGGGTVRVLSVRPNQNGIVPRRDIIEIVLSIITDEAVRTVDRSIVRKGHHDNAYSIACSSVIARPSAQADANVASSRPVWTVSTSFS